MLIDVHAHLHFEQFKKDLDRVIERAHKSGVVAIINSGTDHEGNIASLELARKYDIVKASFGVYPTRAIAVSEKELGNELLFIEKNKKGIAAIGEVGLDFKESQKYEEQKKAFEKIILLANKIKKPLIIHSREAEREAIEILEKNVRTKVIMHCFNGSYKLVKRGVENGWFFSIPPVIVRSMHFQGLVNIVPCEYLLTETDSPFLAPPGEMRNEPSFVKTAINKMAEIKGLTSEEMEKI